MIPLEGNVIVNFDVACDPADATPQATIIPGSKDAIVLRNDNEDLVGPSIVRFPLLRRCSARELKKGLVGGN